MHLDGWTFTFLLMLLALGYQFWTRLPKPPAFALSQVGPYLGKKSWRVYLSKSSEWLFWAAIFFLFVAMSHPRSVEEVNSSLALGKREIPRSGIALYFLLDESGSMSEKVTVRNPQGSRVEIPKIDLAKQAITDFIQGNQGLNLPKRKNDLVGLIAFARVPEVLCPLTLNRQEIATKLAGV